MKFGEICVGSDRPPVVIAELSGNHNGSLARALAIVDAAAVAGAHAIKLQTYTADTMTLDLDRDEFVIADPDSLWNGRTLYDLYREAATPWEWHEPLFRRARQHGLVAFSTPFDQTAVDFLEGLDAPAYKIASFEITDLPLIQAVASTGKPLIMSTGMASDAEISEAIATARENGAGGIALLHCVSGYPTPIDQINLRRLDALHDFDVDLVGISDHSPGATVPIAAVARGAMMVEKHLTLARADGGPDAGFSLEPHEFAQVVRGCKDAWAALGDGSAKRPAAESGSRQFRRSLYAAADIAPGEALTRANVRSIRPGHGLPPRDLPAVIGRLAKTKISRGTPLAWELIA